MTGGYQDEDGPAASCGLRRCLKPTKASGATAPRPFPGRAAEGCSDTTDQERSDEGPLPRPVPRGYGIHVSWTTHSPCHAQAPTVQDVLWSGWQVHVNTPQPRSHRPHQLPSATLRPAPRAPVLPHAPRDPPRSPCSPTLSVLPMPSRSPCSSCSITRRHWA